MDELGLDEQIATGLKGLKLMQWEIIILGSDSMVM